MEQDHLIMQTIKTTWIADVMKIREAFNKKYEKIFNNKFWPPPSFLAPQGSLEVQMLSLCVSVCLAHYIPKREAFEKKSVTFVSWGDGKKIGLCYTFQKHGLIMPFKSLIFLGVFRK